MAKKIREFMTHREPPEHIWMERDESAVIGTARMGQRMVPKIRPFDLLRSTPLSGNRARVTVFEGDSLRIATEHVAGCETQLTRAADHDLVYLQFCGRSKIESESGVVEVEPGEIVYVPAAISHRSTGDGSMPARAYRHSGIRRRGRRSGKADDAKAICRQAFRSDRHREWRQSGRPRPGAGVGAYQLLGSAVGSLGRARCYGTHRLQDGKAAVSSRN